MKKIYIVDLTLINNLITPFSKLNHHTYFYNNRFIIEQIDCENAAAYLGIQHHELNYFKSKQEAENFTKSFIEDKIKGCKIIHNDNINYYKSKYGDDFISYASKDCNDEQLYKLLISFVDEGNFKYIVKTIDSLLKFDSYELLEEFIVKSFFQDFVFKFNLYQEVFNCESKEIEKFKIFSIAKV